MRFTAMIDNLIADTSNTMARVYAERDLRACPKCASECIWEVGFDWKRTGRLVCMRAGCLQFPFFPKGESRGQR